MIYVIIKMKKVSNDTLVCIDFFEKHMNDCFSYHMV